MISLRLTGMTAVVILAAATAYVLPQAQAEEATEGLALSLNNISEQEALAIAKDAYIYAYPLVTMEMTRRVMTNAAEPTGFRAPMGQFANMREYPNASFRDVTAPNADTLYSAAWIDVSNEPWVLSLPEENGRYYLFPILSAWTDVIADPGKRTTGTGPQTYAITGPDWKGTLPEGVQKIVSPTNIVWFLGRTYSTGTPEDYKAVSAIQDKYKLVPLSAYGKPYTPPRGAVNPNTDMKTPVRDQVNQLDAASYFNLAAMLMQENPPAPADEPMIARIAKIGIGPGRSFDLETLTPAVARAVQSAPQAALDEISGNIGKVGRKEYGWVVATTNMGRYGTDYLQRATVAMVGLGANLPEDAVYPMTSFDSQGKKLDGANKYRIHFDKGEMPPVNGFWSLTMYDGRMFFVPNALNRYTLSQRSKFTPNQDGSVDLYIQADSPGGDWENNWLPAPNGDMNLTLRLYWPKDTPPSILDGTWQPPKVEKVAPQEVSVGPDNGSRMSVAANAPMETPPAHEASTNSFSQGQVQGPGVPVYLGPAVVREVQLELSQLGYNPGNVNGVWSPQSASALQAFQQSNGVDPTGNIDIVTLYALGVPRTVLGAVLGEEVTGRAGERPGNRSSAYGYAPGGSGAAQPYGYPGYGANQSYGLQGQQQGVRPQGQQYGQ